MFVSLSLHVLGSQSDLPVGMIFIVLNISQGNLKHSVLEPFRGDLGSQSSANKGFANISDAEDRRRLNVIPVLLSKRVGCLLLSSLFPLGNPLVFPDDHCELARSKVRIWERGG